MLGNFRTQRWQHRIIDIIFLLVIGTASLLAQADESACTVAERDAVQDINTAKWLMLGAFTGPIGFVMSSSAEEIPTARLAARPPEYVAEYIRCYEKKSVQTKRNNVLIGCLATAGCCIAFGALIINDLDEIELNGCSSGGSSSSSSSCSNIFSIGQKSSQQNTSVPAFLQTAPGNNAHGLTIRYALNMIRAGSLDRSHGSAYINAGDLQITDERYPNRIFKITGQSLELEFIDSAQVYALPQMLPNVWENPLDLLLNYGFRMSRHWMAGDTLNIDWQHPALSADGEFRIRYREYNDQPQSLSIETNGRFWLISNYQMYGTALIPTRIQVSDFAKQWSEDLQLFVEADSERPPLLSRN